MGPPIFFTFTLLLLGSNAQNCNNNSCLEMGPREGLELIQRSSKKTVAKEQTSKVEETAARFKSDHCDQSMQSIQDAVQGLIDVPKMVEGIIKNATEKVNNLTTVVDELEPGVEEAKLKYKASRKTIRKSFRTCKKHLRKPRNRRNGKWKNSDECKYFQQYLFTTEEASSNEGCAKRAKCELRSARRKAKKAVKEDYKDIRKNFRDYKKQLRGAKFEKNILPKIITLLEKPMLAALNKSDIGNGEKNLLNVCVADNTPEDCIPLKNVTAMDLLKNFLQMTLHKMLFPIVMNIFSKVEAAIWSLVDPIILAAKSAMIALVGSIPFVGGVLSVAVDIVFKAVHMALKIGVTTAFMLLQDVVRGGIVGKIVGAINFDGSTDDAASQMTEASNSGQKDVLSATQNEINTEAGKAEAKAAEKAKGAESSVSAAGQSVGDEEAADEAAEEDEEEEEESADVQDEEAADEEEDEREELKQKYSQKPYKCKWDCYAKTYKDLMKFGNDEDKLLMHYHESGRQENRDCTCKTLKAREKAAEQAKKAREKAAKEAEKAREKAAREAAKAAKKAAKKAGKRRRKR